MSLETSWPKDTEMRRIADLREFFQMDPEAYNKLSKEDQKECWEYLPQEYKTGKKAFDRPAPAPLKTERRKPRLVQWKLNNSLALIRELKRFVVDNKVGCVGTSTEKWIAISKELSKPCGVEQKEYARSCEVHYESLKRRIKGGKGGKLKLVHEDIRVAMNEFWDTCKSYARSQRQLDHLQSLCACASNLQTPAAGMYSSQIDNNDEVGKKELQ